VTEIRVFPDAEVLGTTLAEELFAGIGAASREGRPYVLGCPGGRSPRTTYQALARVAAGADLGHLVIAMMDDYVVRSPDGGFEQVPAGAHYSCRRFAYEEIAGLLNATARVGVTADRIWLPDPADPSAYRHRLEATGGVDHFIVASGASDGHVAFVHPGTPLDSDVSIVELAQTTRRDNMATFPDFTSLAEVPSYGVSVGLGTIVDLSRAVTLIIHGADKQEAARRVTSVSGFDIDWPATFIHRCQGGRIWLDAAAYPGSDRAEVRAAGPAEE
jgi:glucosamine-6-phosphate deaminase